MIVIKKIDKFLNWITMYRLVLYVLIIWVVIAFIGSLVGFLPDYSPVNIFVTAFVSVAFCYITNFIFSIIFKATTNSESVFITGFIIALVVPVNMHNSYIIASLVSILAMASKYLLTIEKRHIINPAIAGFLAMGLLFGENSARWWVGSIYMFPFVAIGSFLIVRKTRREMMVYTFLGINTLIVCFAAFARGFESANFLESTIDSILTALRQSYLQSAIVFFAAVMLTEPLTSPTSKTYQVYYAIFVGALHATPQLRIGNIIFTPEMALYLGNIFSFLVNPNYRLVLKLVNKIKLTNDTFAFIFNEINGFKFKPGQYMEWTLPHKSIDNRGNRRYFSLASSPTEKTPMMVIKFHQPPSSFKKALSTLPLGGEIIASQLGGDFVLPTDLSKNIVLIAGGVGFAPFRSIIKNIIDNKSKVNITVIFANRNLEDIFYSDLLKQAEVFGVRTLYILTNEKNAPLNWKGLKGHINADMIKSYIPDFMNANYYISGPQIMVQSTERTLSEMGIKKSNIATDFFPGYDA